MTGSYTTIQGDMWDHIAASQLGSSAYTDQLMTANLEYRELYLLPAGITLTLPEVEKPVSSSLPPWKQTSFEGG